MSVVSVDYLSSRSSSTQNAQGLPESTASRVFRVVVNSRTDGARVAERATGVPTIGSAYEDMACKSITAEATDDSQLVWDVTAEYSSFAWPDSDPRVSGNPLLRRPVVAWDGQYISEPVNEDALGAAIENSAHDPFDPGLEEDFPIRVLTITANMIAYDDSTYASALNTVNTDTFMGIPAGQLRLFNVSASEQYENGMSYWAVTFTFHRRVGGWLRRVIDQGFHCLDTGNRKRIVDAAGDPVSTPVFLDGSGGVLDPGDTAVAISFQTKGTSSFAALGIGV